MGGQRACREGGDGPLRPVVLTRAWFALSRARDSVVTCPQAWRPRGVAPLAIAVEIRDFPLGHRAQYRVAGRRQRSSEQRGGILPRDEARVPQLGGEDRVR